jgi:hypothetical protein
MELCFPTFWFKMRASVGSYQWCQCGEGCHHLLTLTTCMCAIRSGVGLMPMVPVRFSLCFRFLFWSLLRFLCVLISGGYLFHSFFGGTLPNMHTYMSMWRCISTTHLYGGIVGVASEYRILCKRESMFTRGEETHNGYLSRNRCRLWGRRSAFGLYSVSKWAPCFAWPPGPSWPGSVMILLLPTMHRQILHYLVEIVEPAANLVHSLPQW